VAQITPFSAKYTLRLNGNLVDLSSPKVMGVINITPDSFFLNSRAANEKDILSRTEKMLEEGADFIDLGGYSSRPGAENISEEEETDRLIPAVKAIAKTFPEAYISADTFRAEVARLAVAEGAAMINDISGGNLDDKMFETVAGLQVPYVLMHMRGTPQTMKEETHYDNLVKDVVKELSEKVRQLDELQVHDIIIDPGFGFAKTIDQNYRILKNLQYFKALGHPVLAGLSRKSMIYRKLGITPEDALNGTTVLNTIALVNGACILRVHDVKEAVETVNLFKSTYN
jgi:dihydropteroate synthase